MTGLRVDKWLWFARFAKTRSAAAKLCAAGLVNSEGARVLKPGHLVRVGDILTVQQGRTLRRVRVARLGERRGSSADALLLYSEAEPPRSPREVERVEWTPLIE